MQTQAPTAHSRRWFTRLVLLAGATALGSHVARAAAAGAARVELHVDVRRGRPVEGVQVLRVKRNDEVALRIDADTVDEVHVHGYDLRRPVAPGKPATLRFVAARTGRFAVELHGADVQISVLEVYPR